MVGPTEALRGRAGGPGMAVPAGAVPGLLDPQERSGWQLAQEVWQESGVVWELPAAESRSAGLPGAGFADSDATGPRPVFADPAPGWPGDDVSARPGLIDSAEAAEPTEPDGAWPDDAEVAYLDADATGDVQTEDVQTEDVQTEDAQAEDAQAGDTQAEVEPADPGLADPAPARSAVAGTWFEGLGPADPRVTARPPGDRPTVVELTRASFADSGVIPMESEFLSPAITRQPTFTPVGDTQLPRRERPQRGSVHDAARPGPPRSAAAPPDYRRRDYQPPVSPRDPVPFRDPQPEDDRIRFGSGPAGRGRRPRPGWDDYPEPEHQESAWPAGSGQVPLSAPVMADAPTAAPYARAGFDSARFDRARFDRAGFDNAALDTAAVPAGTGLPSPLGEPDELFRAWQGSVREASSPRRRWAAPRPGASPGRRRAVQAATIGVPALIIVTVGAGALMMLTGKANQMLAPRSDNGAASSPGPTAQSSVRPSGQAVPAAFAGATLAGYQGQGGTATVASMQMAGGVTLAVGAADGHPAIWRRGADGRWTLESPATLGALPGRAGLASVAYGQAGWLAVGSVTDNGTTQPVVFASADGVTWQPVTTLAGLAGKGTQFLGIAAGHGGYVVVGRQMSGNRIFAVLWYSADLHSWTMESNGGLNGRLAASTVNAVAATEAGFIAVGSHGAAQAIWTSPDGRKWNATGLTLPAGVHSATLTSVAASGDRAVAAGYADTAAGDIPLIVVTVDGGAQWRQIALPAPGGLGVITALTATPDGFAAAGLAGGGKSAHPVTWTSKDGLTWSSPVSTTNGITALAADGTSVVGTSERGANPATVSVAAP